MASGDEQAVQVNDWLHEPVERADSPATAPDLESVHQLAAALDADERLRLTARLWKSLPDEHRAALNTLQRDGVLLKRRANGLSGSDELIDAGPPGLLGKLFDPHQSSDLYSAPRRFDLATIFVVTAAYSILMGALTALGAPPIVKVVIGGLVTIIAVTQAMFLSTVNPRGISIVTGAVAYTLISWLIWAITPYVFPNSFVFVTFINGVVGGSILGYLLGTLVGGVFLVADVLRGKFEGRTHKEIEEPQASENYSEGDDTDE